MAATNEKSENFISLSEEDKKGYLLKLEKEKLPDSFILHSSWSEDVYLLPDITYPDIYHCLANRVPKSV